MYDINEDGIDDRTAWVGGDTAILIFDKDEDGLASGHHEMFGNDQIGGFEMLAGHDTNGDGKIDANDGIWNQLLLWQDINGDGVSTADEMFTLDHFGIIAISLSVEEVNQVINGNNVTVRGDFIRDDGSTLDGYDAWFKYDDGAARNLQNVDGKIVNVIDAGAGDDVYGLNGADLFLFDALGDAATSVHGFNAGEGDAIDLSSVLQGQDDVTDAINDFVFVRQDGNDTVVSVDVTGSGLASNAIDVARIEGAPDLDLDQLLQNGNIIV